MWKGGSEPRVMTPLQLDLVDPFWGSKKTAGGSLGTAHLALSEKGGVFWDPQKTAGGSLGTSHLAFREKGVIFWGPKNRRRLFCCN